MHRACEDAAEHDPDQCGRAVEGAENGAEDGSESRDVQELHHVDGFRIHFDIVDSVRETAGRGGLAGVDTKTGFDDLAVNEIAGDECRDGEKK